MPALTLTHLMMLLFLLGSSSQGNPIPAMRHQPITAGSIIQSGGGDDPPEEEE
jgi:hypothetical protein